MSKYAQGESTVKEVRNETFLSSVITEVASKPSKKTSKKKKSTKE
jgi:hypothetical protein